MWDKKAHITPPLLTILVYGWLKDKVIRENHYFQCRWNYNFRNKFIMLNIYNHRVI